MYNIQGSINNLLQTSSVLASLSPGAKHKAEQVQAEKQYKAAWKAEEAALDEAVRAGAQAKQYPESVASEALARAANEVVDVAEQNTAAAAKRFFEVNPKRGVKSFKHSLAGKYQPVIEEERATAARQAQQAATESAKQALILEQERISATRWGDMTDFGGNI